jgi:DHA1 family multidrug resistance protein-like MFS transporter
MIDWKRNLLFLWIAQLLSLIGFGFAMPFIPFYLQELGITGAERLRLWSGLFAALAGITLAIATPIWGMLADRIGRKPMSLRANLGGAVVLLGMGLARTPGQLLVFRVAQGVLTGTITANLTLAVAGSPKNRTGFVIGVMNAAVFTGNALGPLLGGTIADRFGYRASFFAASLVLLAAFLLTMFVVREEFIPPPPQPPGPPARRLVRLLRTSGLPSIVGLIFLVGAGRYLPWPLYPLRVQEIALPGLGVATQAGMVSAVDGVAAVLAGVLIGVLADRGKLLLLGMLSAVLAGLCLAPQGIAPGFSRLLPLVFGSAFAGGGVDAVLTILIARRVKPERRGAAFGLAGSAKSAGWAFGALGGGYLAATLGFPAAFLIGGGLYLLLAVLIGLRGAPPEPPPAGGP